MRGVAQRPVPGNGFDANRWLCRVGLALIAATLVGGCDTSPPEKRLVEAADQLADTRLDLDDLNREIERTESELESLRRERQALRARQLTLEERVRARATDVALFRTIQSNLLAVEELQNTAIVVTVEDGYVTLRGRVSTEEERDIAVATAQNAPAIAGLKSRILVDEQPTSGGEDG